jgi:malonyl-CoA/methylmalonyl-CoA synthetase
MNTANGNIYALFAHAAGKVGDKPLLIDNGHIRLRFHEMDHLVGRIAHKLRATGAQAGDRIVVQVEKSPEAVFLYLASLRAGLVFVPLNTAHTPAEVAYYITDTEPAILVCDSARRQSLASINLPNHCTVLTLDANGSGTLMDSLPDQPLATEPREPEDLASILYTSGTTGRSKGAMLSHRNLASNALTLHELWHWQPGDVLLHALPIYHVHGLFVALHGALLNGSTILFHRRFDAAAVLKDLPNATVFMGVPTHYTRLLDHPELTTANCRRIRLFVSGSAPLLPETFTRFASRTGHTILERYGMTETGMIASNPYHAERVPGTVGYALPGVSVRIAGAEGAIQPPGSPGVLEVSGPNVFQGYWRLPEKTAEEFRPDGFFITGDVAVCSADGRVSIVGRAKDLIISGGMNVYPKEIELLIDVVPGVRESAVIGVPHSDFGEAVVAIVTRDHPSLPDEKAVLAALNGRLARFKQPKRVIFVPELPRNAMGKIQKAALRAEFATLFT